MKRVLILMTLILLPFCVSAAPAPQVPQEILNFLHNKPTANKISATHLLKRMASDEKITFIDVRTPQEFAVMHITDAINIPYDKLAENLDKIPREGLVVAVCHSGRRAEGATTILHLLGYSNVVNLSGGIKALAPAITSKSAPALKPEIAPSADIDSSPDDDDDSDEEEDFGC